MTPDYAGLNRYLCSRSREILPRWFRNGKISGNEFKVGNLAGDTGDSLSINLNTGVWSDFATDEKGGDLVSLFASKLKISQSDAFKRLVEEFGFQGNPALPPDQQAQRPIGRPPKDAQRPNFVHREFGPAVARWPYEDW